MSPTLPHIGFSSNCLQCFSSPSGPSLQIHVPQSFNDSRSLFNDLWAEWLDTQLLDIASDTPMKEMDYEDILKCLPPEKQQELSDMRKRFAEKAGVGDTAQKSEENKMSILERLYMGELCPLEESVCNDTKYHSLLDKIRTERHYFEEILSEENKERFKEWNMMILRHEDIEKYERFAQGFRLGAMLASEIYSGSEGR